MRSLYRTGLLLSLAMFGGVSVASAAASIPVADISRVFAQISSSPTLASPSMILIDRATGEVVFQKDATSLRRPASILKLLSTSATLEYLGPNYRYVTRVSNGTDPGTLVIAGQMDPWMTGSHFEATKYHRGWLQYLVNRSIAEMRSEQRTRLRDISINYSGLYAGDVSFLKRAFVASGVNAKFQEIGANRVNSVSGSEIAKVTSPPISAMVKFALTWSDNLLAERLVRAAAHAVGFPMNDAGVAQTIKKLLTDLNVDQSGLFIHDGSGLSHDDRVTAKLIADLLLKIRVDPKFASIYTGLPISGVSGTLEYRFRSTAPQAVGLVHAKTGTLDGTISLAGFVESGSHEYVFVGIADHIKKGDYAANQARSTIDRLLGKITAPLKLVN